MPPGPTSTEQRHLDDLLSAMRGPCVEELGPTSSISQRFADEFRTTLLIHHYFLNAPLATSSFEAAFVRAAEAAGHTVTPAPDGNRFWDVDVDGRRISLKSTAPKVLSLDRLHISKLCEAAWIQDVRSAAAREQETKQLFASYTGTVDSIIQLRLFKRKAMYELVEVPVAMLKQVASVPRAHFSADGPTIGIPIGADSPDSGSVGCQDYDSRYRQRTMYCLGYLAARSSGGTDSRAR